ncbi:hypothetical protein BJY52DRAFT_1212081 [Lactarius psammicola]|nr:hypothetical protein BJY52DRAFT_1212081 [Lactarius psammicola]
MTSTTTVTPIEHELNSGAVSEDRALGAHYLKLASPPGDNRLAINMVASADANANTSSTDDDDDDITQSDADDHSGGSSDGTDPETEALEKEMERYVPRTKPSQPAVGAKVSNIPYTQGKPTSTGTKGGRPLAVTATVKTTKPSPKK